MRRCAGWTLALSATVSCGQSSAPVPTSATLGGEVARVGEGRIPGSIVASVARSRGESPASALDELLDDALLASAAQSRGLDRHDEAAFLTDAALARLVFDRAVADATAAGDPTDVELGDVTVTHAVVLRSASLSDEAAKAIAAELVGAVSEAHSAEDFDARARAVLHPRAQLRVERLPAFDAEGRTATGEMMDGTFVAASFALRHPAETSGIVETPFGWHVIRLIDHKIPDAAVLEIRRSSLREPVMQMRARVDVDGVLRSRRQKVRVEIAPSVDENMAEAFSRMP